MRKFEITITGQDGYEFKQDIEAETFNLAYVKAQRLLESVQKLTIEALDIESIAELNF